MSDDIVDGELKDTSRAYKGATAPSTESRIRGGNTLTECGDNCHPERYVPFMKRTRLGMKRWGVRDEHTGRSLSRLCRDELELYHWLVSLRTMELRLRWAMADRFSR
ncbi:hypothetical protein AB0E67_27600 [Streptomyces sp. NPDC032161]|uniref:hypothetical protein n=1 Tax=unclassified Streptomyces TaxID=2593676 RepID=UPI0033E438E4